MVFIVIWVLSPVVLIPLSIYLCVDKRKRSKQTEELRRIIEVSNTEISHLQQRIKNLKEYQAKLSEASGEEISTLPQSIENNSLKSISEENVASAIDGNATSATTENVVSAEIPVAFDVHEQERKHVKKGLPSGTALFGIGILFVLVAGAIFATTTWQILPAAGKVLTLLGAVAVFFISSYISEKKFDLRETSITFFLLGSSFLSVINLGIGYFRWFGDFYVLSGDQTYLVICVSTIILSCCLIVGRKIYDVDLLGMLAYLFLLASVLLFIRFLTDEASAMILAAGISLVLSLLYVYYRRYSGYTSCIAKCVDKMSYAYLILTISVLSNKTDIFVGVFILLLGLVISFIISVLLDDSNKKMAILQIYGAVVAFALPLKIAIGYKDIPAVFFFLGCAYVYTLIFRFIKLPNEKEIGSILTDCLSVILMLIASFTLIEAPTHKQSTSLIILVIWVIILASFVAFMFLFKETSRKTVRIADFVNVDISLFAISIAGLLLYNINSIVAWQLIPVIFAIIAILCFELQENNFGECIPVAALFLFAGNITHIVFDEKDSVLLITNITFFIIAIVLGRVLFKFIYNVTDNKKSIDWFAIFSFIFIVSISERQGEYIPFICYLLAALYFSNAYKRVPDLIYRIALSISAILVGVAFVYWPFFEIKSTFEMEWNVTVVLLVIFAGGFIWNNIEKFYSILASFLLVFISYSYLNEMIYEIEYLSVGRTTYIAVLKIIFYIMPALVLFAISLWKKNKVYLIASGLIIIGTSWLARFLVVKWIMVIPILLGLVYAAFLYIKNEKNLLLIPIVQAYALLIAFEVPTYIYLIVFIVAIVYGYISYGRVIENSDFQLTIDWFTVTSILPVIMVASSEKDKWIFCATMMFAANILCYYKRITDDKRLNNAILSVASIVLGLSFIRQPFFKISDSWETEWFLLFVWIVVIFNIVYVYRDYDNDKKHIVMYCFAIASIVWQSMDAISSDNVYDAMILGVVMVALLIVSFLLKKKMWFMLAAITLILQAIYTSRRFWLSIAWWVYLLAVGVLLIAIAAINEYRKRNGSEEREHMQLFSDWNKW